MTKQDLLRIKITQKNLLDAQEFVDNVGPRCDDARLKARLGLISNDLTNMQIDLEILVPEDQMD